MLFSYLKNWFFGHYKRFFFSLLAVFCGIALSTFFRVMAVPEPRTSAQTPETVESSVEGSSLEQYLEVLQIFLDSSQCLDNATKQEILTRAQGISESQETELASNLCIDYVEKCFQGHEKQFQLFSDHFKNEAPNSELVPAALALSRAFDEESLALQDITFYLIRYGKLVPDTSATISDCIQFRTDLYEKTFQPALEEYIKETTTAKKSYQIVQKYKSINSKLAILNDTMAKWSSYMGTFAQKVPALSKSCQ